MQYLFVAVMIPIVRKVAYQYSADPNLTYHNLIVNAQTDTVRNPDENLLDLRDGYLVT